MARAEEMGVGIAGGQGGKKKKHLTEKYSQCY